MNGIFITIATIEERIWDRNDTYLVIETQVLEKHGFKKGDKVKVNIEKV